MVGLFGGADAGSVFVRIGAQFDDRGFDEFGRRHVKAQRAKDIETRLKGEFDPRSFNLYEQRLDQVQARVRRREAFKATLGADYNAQAFRAYERDLARAERETKTSMTRMRSSLAYGFGFLTAGGAYGAVTAVKSVTQAYGESEVSARKMQAQLKAVGVSYKDHAAEIDRVIQKHSQLAGLDDEALQDAFTNIVRVTGDVDKSLRLVGLAADFARAKNLDAAKAGEIIGKVAGGNIGVLGRYGIKVKEGATATEALGLLQDKFAGQAEAYGKTQSGAADRARTAWENLREKLGEKLAPTFTRLANKAADFLNEMESGTGQGGRFADRMKKVGEALEDLLRVLGKVAGFVADNTTAVLALAAAWTAVKVQARLAAAAQMLAGAGSLIPGRKPGGGGGPVPVPGPTPSGGGGGRWSKFGRTAGNAVWPFALGLAAADIVAGDEQTPNQGARVRPTPPPDRSSVPVTATTTRRVRSSRRGDPDSPEELTRWYGQLGKQLGVTAKEADKLKGAMQFGRPLAGLSGETLVTLRKRLKDVRGGTDETRQGLRQLKIAIDDALDKQLGSTLKETDRNWDRFNKKAGTTISDVRREVGRNTKKIRESLGDDTRQGAAALAENFQDAAAAVRKQMQRGTTSTKDGTAEINRLLRKALIELGFSAIGKVSDLFSDAFGSNKKAGGGWIGMPGMVGTDTVPAMLAPGEAVLNRHQQAVIEGYLGDGFLDRLFARVQRPHYMAKGGIVPVPGFPGEFAARSVLPMISTIARRFGLTLTDAYGQGHKSPGHTRFGTAADFAGSDRNMDRAVRWLVGRGFLVGYDGRFGSQAWPGHGPSSVAGGNAHLHVELGGAGDRLAGAAVKDLKAPRAGLRGVLGAIVQGNLNVATAGANRVLRKLAGTPPAPVAGGGTRRAPSGGGTVWGASEFGGPGDPGTGFIGYRGDDLRRFPLSYAELNMGTAMGNLPYLQPLRVTGPAGSLVLRKRDIGAGGGDVQGKTRGIDLWYKAAERLGVRGLGLVRVQRLAKGGRVGSRLSSRQTAVTSAGVVSPATGSVSALRGLQGKRIAAYESWMAAAARASADYEQLDRQFNLSEEEFVKDDGTLDQDAINQRAGELGLLKQKLVDRLGALRQAQRIAARIVNTYRTIIERMTAARDALTGKKNERRRGEYTTKLDTLRTDLGTWDQALKDFDRGGQFSIDDAVMDVAEMDKEIGGVTGTKATSASDVADSTITQISQDTQAVLDQAQARTRLAEDNLKVANQVIQAFGSPGDLGIGGRNAFGAATTVTQNFNMLHPGDPRTQQQIAAAAIGGTSFQGGITSPRTGVV